MVGALTNGSGADPFYNCTKFAQKGIVSVTINYRLEIEGFLYLKDAVPNRGLLDQVYALEWVRDNIRAFGGDPHKVTIGGQSAGGMCIGSLLVMPKAKGLFKRAILQSGAGKHVLTVSTAQKVTQVFEQVSGLSATSAALANIPRTKLSEYLNETSKAILTSPDTAGWIDDLRKNFLVVEPVIDGVMIPDYPEKIYESEESSHVDILAGYTAEDGRSFVVPQGLWGTITEDMFNNLVKLWGNPEEAKTVYCKEYPNDISQLYCSVWTDSFYRLPVLRVAEANARKKKNKTFYYCFSLPSPVFRNGAHHATEMPFVFHVLEERGSEMILGNLRPVELADRMNKAWADFIRDGNPGWPEYDLKDRIMMDFNVESKVVKDLCPLTRKWWEVHYDKK